MVGQRGAVGGEGGDDLRVGRRQAPGQEPVEVQVTPAAGLVRWVGSSVLAVGPLVAPLGRLGEQRLVGRTGARKRSRGTLAEPTSSRAAEVDGVGVEVAADDDGSTVGVGSMRSSRSATCRERPVGPPWLSRCGATTTTSPTVATTCAAPADPGLGAVVVVPADRRTRNGQQPAAPAAKRLRMAPPWTPNSLAGSQPGARPARPRRQGTARRTRRRRRTPCPGGRPARGPRNRLPERAIPPSASRSGSRRARLPSGASTQSSSRRPRSRLAATIRSPRSNLRQVVRPGVTN